MTQEQKAKAYDEALERAKKQLEEAKVFDYEEGQIAHDIRTTTYAIFPELSESEDERIRKELLAVINDLVLPNEQRARFNAWLEKQKDSVSNAKYIEDVAHAFEDGRKKGIEEKQKEQKSITINQDEKEFLADEITAFLCNYDKEFDGEDPVPSEVAEHFYLLGKQAQEQKPVINIDQLKSLMLQYFQEAANEKNDSDIQADTDKWARKILGQNFEQKEQKPVEWSKEDENKLNHILEIVHIASGREASVDEKEELESFLKSLRPQPQQEWSEKNTPKWKKVTDYTKLPTDAIVRYESDKNPQIENAISEQDVSRILGFRKPIAYYLTPDDLNKLPKED